MGTWFDTLFDEYKGRGEAMFAFSESQIEEQGVPIEEFRAGWVAIGAGLYVKRDVRVKFLHAFHTGEAAFKSSCPELSVRYVGESSLDYPAYRALNAIESLGVAKGDLLVDIEYGEPNKADYLHVVASEEFPEPSHQLDARVVFAGVAS